MKQTKLMTGQQAAALISDNSSILLFDGYEPVSLIRELLQQNSRGLTLYTCGLAFCAALLAACGAADHILAGCDPGSGFIPEAECTSGFTPEVLCVGKAVLKAQLAAAVNGGDHAAVPVPERLLTKAPALYREVPGVFGAGTVTAAAALHPDVAILHTARADFYGNVQLDPSADMRDADTLRLALAAKTVIVSAEQIVSDDAIRMNARCGLFEPEAVACVVEAPYGAHPTAFATRYRADEELLRAYEAKEDPAAFARRHLLSFPDQDCYLAGLGFERLISLTTNRRGEA